MKTNPVQALEGSSVVDFDIWAQALPEQERDDFIDAVSLIADSDLQGRPGIIDPGDETLAAAHLIFSSCREFACSSITSTDISGYQAKWGVSREILVKSEVARIEQAARGWQVEVVVDGDPRIGTVIHVLQLHRSSAPPVNGPWRIPKDYPVICGEYQYAILRFLKDYRPNTIFEEGRKVDLPPSDPSRADDQTRGELARFFAGGKIGAQPDSRQLAILQGISPAFIYAMLDNRRAHLSATTTEAKQNQLRLARQNVARELSSGNEERLPEVMRNLYREVFTDCEADAADRVMGFLDGRPGQRVVIVYGASHNFGDNFPHAPRPLVIQVYRDDLIRRALGVSQGELRRYLDEATEYVQRRPGDKTTENGVAIPTIPEGLIRRAGPGSQ